MKYNIGEIVKYFEDMNNTYIVIATKEQPLNIDFMKSTKANINIDRLEDYAYSTIRVSNGFDYLISKLLFFKDEIAEIGSDPINVFEEDIER